MQGWAFYLISLRLYLFRLLANVSQDTTIYIKDVAIYCF